MFSNLHDTNDTAQIPELRLIIISVASAAAAAAAVASTANTIVLKKNTSYYCYFEDTRLCQKDYSGRGQLKITCFNCD